MATLPTLVAKNRIKSLLSRRNAVRSGTAEGGFTRCAYERQSLSRFLKEILQRIVIESEEGAEVDYWASSMGF